MTDYHIRPYRPEDAPAIARIFAYYVEHTTISFETVAPDATLFAERATHILERSPYLVAEQDGKVIGYAYAKPWSALPAYRRCFESTIYLAHDRDYRRTKGLGTVLYQQLITELPQKTDIRSLYGIITQNNIASERLHKKMGFRYISTLPAIGYKFDEWLDVSQWLYEYFPVDNKH